MKRITVHAGLHKTGTSTFQRFCHINRVILKKYGVAYFDDPEYPCNHTVLLQRLYNTSQQLAAESTISQQRFLKEALSQVSPSPINQLLISGEGVSTFTHDNKLHFVTALLSLGFFCEVIIVIRPPSELVRSIVQQNLKSPGQPSLFFGTDRLERIVSSNYSNLYRKKIRPFMEINHAQYTLTVVDYRQLAQDGRRDFIPHLLGICCGDDISTAVFSDRDVRRSKDVNNSLSMEAALLIDFIKHAGAPPLTQKDILRLMHFRGATFRLPDKYNSFAEASRHQIPWLLNNFHIDYRDSLMMPVASRRPLQLFAQPQTFTSANNAVDALPDPLQREAGCYFLANWRSLLRELNWRYVN
jgi:hypothetical protein